MVTNICGKTSYEGGVPVFMQIPFSEEDIAPPSSALYPFISHKSLTWSLKDQRLFRVKQVMGLLEENEPEAEYEGLGPLINFDRCAFQNYSRKILIMY